MCWSSAACGIRPNVLVFGNDYDTIDGTGVRDYVHVTDLADAHVKAADYISSQNKDLVVGLGSETGLSVMQIIEASRRITGKPIPSQIEDHRQADPLADRGTPSRRPGQARRKQQNGA